MKKLISIITIIATTSCTFIEQKQNEKIVEQIIKEYTFANMTLAPKNGVDVFNFDKNNLRLEVCYFYLKEPYANKEYHKDSTIRGQWKFFIHNIDSTHWNTTISTHFDFVGKMPKKTEEMVIDLCRKLKLNYTMEIKNINQKDTIMTINVKNNSK